MAFPPSGAASVRAVPALLPKFPPPVRVLYPSLSLVSIFFFFWFRFSRTMQSTPAEELETDQVAGTSFSTRTRVLLPTELDRLGTASSFGWPDRIHFGEGLLATPQRPVLEARPLWLRAGGIELTKDTHKPGHWNHTCSQRHRHAHT